MLKKIILFLAMALAVVSFTENTALAKSDQFDMSLRKGETRKTLDPALFTHATVKKAYQVAKEIPWVLDSIYCYCYCKESPVFKHKSLLSCYVDNHAAQ